VVLHTEWIGGEFGVPSLWEVGFPTHDLHPTPEI
jgi:hypothetical protein